MLLTASFFVQSPMLLEGRTVDCTQSPGWEEGSKYHAMNWLEDEAPQRAAQSQVSSQEIARNCTLESKTEIPIFNYENREGVALFKVQVPSPGDGCRSSTFKKIYNRQCSGMRGRASPIVHWTRWNAGAPVENAHLITFLQEQHKSIFWNEGQGSTYLVDERNEKWKLWLLRFGRARVPGKITVPSTFQRRATSGWIPYRKIELNILSNKQEARYGSLQRGRTEKKGCRFRHIFIWNNIRVYAGIHK